jgi:hypothetical protein
LAASAVEAPEVAVAVPVPARVASRELAGVVSGMRAAGGWTGRVGAAGRGIAAGAARWVGASTYSPSTRCLTSWRAGTDARAGAVEELLGLVGLADAVDVLGEGEAAELDVNDAHRNTTRKATLIRVRRGPSTAG